MYDMYKMLEQIIQIDTKIIDAIIVPYIYDPMRVHERGTKAEMLLRSPIARKINNMVWHNAFSAEDRIKYMDFVNEIADAIIANGLFDDENRYLEHASYEFEKLTKLKDFNSEISLKNFMKLNYLLTLEALNTISKDSNKEFLAQLSDLTMLQILALGVICYNP